MYVYIQSLNFLLLRDPNDYASMIARCNLWRSRIVRVYQIWESSTHYMLLKFQITKVISLQHLQPSSYSRACSTMLTNTQFVYSLSTLIKKHITYCQNIHCFAFWGSLWLRLRFIGFLLSLFGSLPTAQRLPAYHHGCERYVVSQGIEMRISESNRIPPAFRFAFLSATCWYRIFSNFTFRIRESPKVNLLSHVPLHALFGNFSYIGIYVFSGIELSVQTFAGFSRINR